MNVHERIRKTLDHEEPDRVPTLAQVFEYVFTKKVFDSISPSEKPKILSTQRQMLEAAIYMGFDSIWYHYEQIKRDRREMPTIPEEIKKDYGIESCDDWAHYEKNGWYQDGVLKTPEFLEEWISYLNSWEPAREVFFRRFKKIWDKYASKGLVTIPTSGSVAFALWSMIGMNRFAYMVRKHFSLVKDLAKALGKITLELHRCFFEQGVDMVFICDDWALKEKTLYNPKHWNALVTPIYKILAKNAHKYDAKLLIHSDGNVTETLPFLIDSGVDAIEPLEYESGVRLKPLKEEFGDKITLIGNVAASDILTYGTKEDTINATKQALKDAGIGGGYILGAGSDILGTCKLENVKAMIVTSQKFGKYPINI